MICPTHFSIQCFRKEYLFNVFILNNEYPLTPFHFPVIIIVFMDINKSIFNIAKLQILDLKT